MVRLAVTGLALLAPVLLAPSDRLATQQPIDFVRDVRPILSNHCFACHGPDAHGREADLDLSRFETAREVVAPGDVEASELWRRINDRDDPMPPAKAHDPLSAEQVETLGRWIEAGASYAPHWAFVDPRPSEPPAVADADWPRDPFDRYLLASWERDGLRPAADADRATLLRRLSYDLTGLPPTLAELDAFVAGAVSFRQVVDRLLQSPHFGERMAMMWLDLVRYADTVGYHGDQDHRAWPYRDYVIRAFGDNLPFDRFTIEQLAGDLLPEPTQDQLVATAYNRLLQTSHEGGVQLGEYREIYLADRVRNVSAVWMGATVGCAQCHDHKFDPYTARDFFSLGAFFADVDDEEHLRNQYGGLNTLPTRRSPEMRVYSPTARADLARLVTEIAAAQQRVERAVASLAERRPAWRARLLQRIEQDASQERTWIDDVDDTGGKRQGDWSFGRRDGVAPHSGEHYRTQTADAMVQHYTAGTSKQIDIEGGEELFAWVYLDPVSPPTAVMLQFQKSGSDWQHRAVWGSDDISYGRRQESWAGYRRRGPLPATGRWVRLSVAAADVGLRPGDEVRGMAFTQFGGTVHWDRSGVASGPAPSAVVAALTAADPDVAEQRVIADHHRRTDRVVAAAERELAQLRSRHDELERAQPMSLFTRALAEPRTVKIRPRGNWLDESGDVVMPAIPGFLGELSTTGRASRLDLARWLVARDGHGLRTARVFVNRVWALFYGNGLCPSTEDFGGQGRPPTYPELLDAVAIAFVDSGWDVKALVRRLVSMRAYAIASQPSAATRAADPFNERFARQSRRRLPAEMIRDTALALGGLLVREVGGASVKPPQPAGYYRHLNFPKRRYRADRDARQWRRGVYVHWQRQFLHPMLRAFDAPTREECTTQRPVSNTPTAALTLLNDPVFVEAARAFAERMLAADGDDETRIRRAFRRATARRPGPRELAVLTRLLQTGREHYRTRTDAATALLGVGDSPRDPSVPPAEHAAWTEVARAILNLHETITRG